MAQSYVDATLREPGLARFVMALIHNPPRSAPATDFAGFYDGILAEVARTLEVGVAHGEITAGPTDIRLLVFMGALGEAMHGYLLVGRPELTPALAETLVGFGFLPALLPPERLGFVIRLDASVLLRVLIVTLPLLLLANALMALVAVRARSFRQAQTTISLLMLVPAIPGVLLALSPVKPQGWMQATPFLAEQVIMSRLVRGEVVGLASYAAAVASSLLVAALVLIVTVKLFESGKLLFDR